MTDGRCEPPKGTPAGTVCVLSCEGDTSHDRDRIEFHATWWDGRMWKRDGAWPVSPREADLCGWRFVRVVDTKAKPYRDPSVQWWE